MIILMKKVYTDKGKSYDKYVFKIKKYFIYIISELKMI